jgi:arabinoxylan arabinofuranohydrolase
MIRLKYNTLPVLVLVSTLFSLAGVAQNPIVQTVYTADPAPLVYKDTVFLYTGHDEDKSTWFVMKDWRCYSTTDMVNWTDRGAPLSLKTFSWAKKDAWAGQCIYRNGKFYWYVPMNEVNGKGMSIGVAVSTSPTGPFTDAIGKPLIHSGSGDIDPTVFIDDDGQAYLYWGNPYLKYVKLNEDMISYSGDVVTIEFTPQNFGVRTGDPKRSTQYEEGPWLYKRKGLYYLLFPAGGVPEHLAYSTGPGPTGPWTYQDTIMPIIKKGGAFTNHPGIIDYKGNSYFFYHNGDLPGGGGFDRSVCAMQFNYNENGSIPRIQHSVEGITKCVGDFDPMIRKEAETISFESGVETAQSDKLGIYVTDIDNYDYIKVRSVNFNKKVKNFKANVASASQDSKIEIHIDSLTGPLLGTLNVKNTGELQKWAIQSCKVNAVVGIHDLYFVFEGGEGDLLNFDWWVFN